MVVFGGLEAAHTAGWYPTLVQSPPGRAPPLGLLCKSSIYPESNSGHSALESGVVDLVEVDPASRDNIGLRRPPMGRYAGLLITAIVAPELTGSPSLTASCSTTPALCAAISFSIFIASMMQTT